MEKSQLGIKETKKEIENGKNTNEAMIIIIKKKRRRKNIRERERGCSGHKDLNLPLSG